MDGFQAPCARQGMEEVVLACTLATQHPPSPPTIYFAHMAAIKTPMRRSMTKMHDSVFIAGDQP